MDCFNINFCDQHNWKLMECLDWIIFMDQYYVCCCRCDIFHNLLEMNTFWDLASFIKWKSVKSEFFKRFFSKMFLMFFWSCRLLKLTVPVWLFRNGKYQFCNGKRTSLTFLQQKVPVWQRKRTSLTFLQQKTHH